MNEYRLLLVPGDGIGPEVMDATMRVVGWFGQKGLAYQTEEALLGGVAIDTVGRPDPDETFAKANARITLPRCVAGVRIQFSARKNRNLPLTNQFGDIGL